MLIPSANVVLDFLWEKKAFGSHQGPLINPPKKGQRELTTLEIKNHNFELISKSSRISSSK